jgi:hypothetical protein
MSGIPCLSASYSCYLVPCPKSGEMESRDGDWRTSTYHSIPLLHLSLNCWSSMGRITSCDQVRFSIMYALVSNNWILRPKVTSVTSWNIYFPTLPLHICAWWVKSADLYDPITRYLTLSSTSRLPQMTESRVLGRPIGRAWSEGCTRLA